MRGFLWPTEFLVFSDFLVADPHAHGTLQLSVGIDGSPRVRLDGTCKGTAAHRPPDPSEFALSWSKTAAGHGLTRCTGVRRDHRLTHPHCGLDA